MLFAMNLYPWWLFFVLVIFCLGNKTGLEIYCTLFLLRTVPIFIHWCAQTRKQKCKTNFIPHLCLLNGVRSTKVESHFFKRNSKFLCHCCKAIMSPEFWCQYLLYPSLRLLFAFGDDENISLKSRKRLFWLIPISNESITHQLQCSLEEDKNTLEIL